MDRLSKISSAQFFSLLLLSRLLSTLTFMPVFHSDVRTSDYIISMAIGSILVIIFCIPVFMLFNKSRENGLINTSFNISPVFSKIISVLYAAFFVFYAFTTLARTELFVSTIVFPDTETTFFVLVAIAAACYAASLGFEALGRAGSVSLFLFCASFAFILITMSDKIKVNNLSPVFYDGIFPVAEVSWSFIIRTIEPAMMLILLPRVTGNVKKGFSVWIAALLVINTAIFFFLMTTLGECSLLQMFPVHAMATLSEFSVLERLDVLLTGVWIISAFIKVSFTIFIASDLLSTSFKKEYNHYYIVAIGVVLAVLMYFTSISILSFQITISFIIRTVVFAAFVVVIPLIVFVLKKICGKVRK